VAAPPVADVPASDAHAPTSTPAAPAHAADALSAPQTLAAAQAALDAQKDAVQHAAAQLTADQVGEATAQAKVDRGGMGSRDLAAARRAVTSAHEHVVADQAALDDATAKLQAAQQAYDAAARGQTPSAPSAPVAKDPAPQAPQPVAPPVSAAPPVEHAAPSPAALAPTAPSVADPRPVQTAPAPAPSPAPTPAVAVTPASDTHAPASTPAPQTHAADPAPATPAPHVDAPAVAPSSPVPPAHTDPAPTVATPAVAPHAIVPPAAEPGHEAVPQMQPTPDFTQTISLTSVVKQVLPAERLPTTGINLDTIQKLQFPDHTFATATGAINQDNTASGAVAAGVGVTAATGLDNGVSLTVKTGVGASAQAVIGQNSYQLQAGAAAGAAAQFDFGSGVTLDVTAQAQGSAFLKVGGPDLLAVGAQGSAGLSATIQQQQSFDVGSALSGTASAGVSAIIGATGDATFGLTGIKTKGGVGAVIELSQSASIDVGTVMLAERSGVISPGSLAGGAGLGVTVGDGKVNLNFNLSLALGIGGFNAAVSVGLDYQTLGNTVGTFLFGGGYDIKPFDPVKYGLDHAIAAPPTPSADTLVHAQQLATDFMAQKGITLGGVGDPLSALSPAAAKEAAAFVVAGQAHMDSSSLDFRQQSHRTAYAQDFISKAYDAIDQNHLTGAKADLQIRAASIAAEDWLSKQPGVSQAEVAQFRVDRVQVMLQHDQKEMDAAGAAAKPYFQQLFAEHQADASKAVVDLYVSNGTWQPGRAAADETFVASTQASAAQALAKFGGAFPDGGYADHVSSNAATLLNAAQALVALQPHPPETSANYGSGLIEGAYALIRDHNLSGQAAQRQIDAALYVAEQHYIDQHGTAGFNATREGLLNQVIAHDSERLMVAGPGEQAELQHTVALNQLSAYVSHSYAQAGIGAYSRAVQLNDLNQVDASDLAAIHNAQVQFQHTDGPGPQNWQSDASLKTAALAALADQLSPHAPAKGASQAEAMQYAKDLLTATYANIAEHGLSGTEAQSRINAAVYLGKAALHDGMPNASAGELAVAFSQQAQQHLYLDQVRLGAAGAATQADAQSALVATTMELQTLSSQAIALSDKSFSYDKIDKAEHDGMAQFAAAKTDDQKNQAYATALQGVANLPATPPKDYAGAMKAAHDLVEMAYASIEARAASGKPVVDGGAAFLLEAARHTAEKWVMDTHPSALDQAKFDVMAAQQKLQHDQIGFAAATGAERTSLANAVQADVAALASAPARIAALQATENLLAPHQYWSTQVTTGGGYDPYSYASQGYGAYANTYDPANAPAYGNVAANGPRADVGAAVTEVHGLWDKYNALQGKDDYTGQLILKDILTTSRAVLQNFPHPVEAAVTTTDANGNTKVLQTGIEHLETYARDLMQSTYAYIEKQHLGPKDAALYLDAAKNFMDATLKQDYAQPDLVARVHLAVAQAAADEHQRQLILAPDDAKADLAKQVYQDRLDVARLSSEAFYYDSNWQHASTTPQAAQQGAQARLDSIDPHSSDAAARQLDVYKQVLAGQPQPYLEQQNQNTSAEVGVDQVALTKATGLNAAEKYAAQLLECAFATVDVKGLTGQAAALQIKAAIAVGEDAVRHATTPLEFAEYRVKEANHILQHTQQKAELYGNQGGLDQALQSNQTFLLQALADVYRLDDRVVSADKTGDALAVARAKKAVTQELLTV
jgi:hypothetical protein